eukprot:2643615-Lingulodinium_polyedra.AAC.1
MQPDRAQRPESVPASANAVETDAAGHADPLVPIDGELGADSGLWTWSGCVRPCAGEHDGDRL